MGKSEPSGTQKHEVNATVQRAGDKEECPCANFYGYIRCRNRVKEFGDRCEQCEENNRGSGMSHKNQMWRLLNYCAASAGYNFGNNYDDDGGSYRDFTRASEHYDGYGSYQSGGDGYDDCSYDNDDDDDDDSVYDFVNNIYNDDGGGGYDDCSYDENDYDYDDDDNTIIYDAVNYVLSDDGGNSNTERSTRLMPGPYAERRNQAGDHTGVAAIGRITSNNPPPSDPGGRRGSYGILPHEIKHQDNYWEMLYSVVGSHGAYWSRIGTVRAGSGNDNDKFKYNPRRGDHGIQLYGPVYHKGMYDSKRGKSGNDPAMMMPAIGAYTVNRTSSGYKNMIPTIECYNDDEGSRTPKRNRHSNGKSHSRLNYGNGCHRHVWP